MKKIIVIAFTVVLSLNSFAIKFMNKEFVLFDVNIEMSNELMEKFIQKYGPMISTNPNKTVIIKKLQDNLYYAFKDYMVKEKELIILPVNTFGEKFKYDAYGYPESTLKKAIKKVNSHYYFKLDFEIVDIRLKGDDWTKKEENMVEKPEDYIVPSFKIIMTIYNDKGSLPIEKFEEEVTILKNVPMEAAFMNGIVNSKTDYKEPELMYLLNETTKKVAANIIR